jgi:glycosyltransferase involved in cell wall biosynthesis
MRRHPGSTLHAHTSATLTLASLARRLAPTAGIVHTRRVAFPVRPSSKYRTAAERYVAISEAVAGELLAAGLDPERLTVVRSAVDLEIDAEEPVAGLADDDSPVACCVAAMTAEKGLATLMRAWTGVSEAFPGSRLVLLGDGPLRAELEAAAPPSVTFAGFQARPGAWLGASSLYVQPSLCEGLGTSVLDAMACRLPVVASRTGGLTEAVVDGVTGLLVPPGDAGALAGALIDLLGTPRRAESMGAAGRRRVEQQFTVSAMVDGYLEVYRSVTHP